MNPFDSLKFGTFDIITSNMGYDALWTPSDLGSTELEARVGYKDPTEKQELSGIDSWNPKEPFMEYRTGFFEGLKYNVDHGLEEIVTIDTKGVFSVREVLSKFDGDCFVARLAKI